MNKNKSQGLLPVLSSQLKTDHSQTKSHRYFRQMDSTIPKVEQDISVAYIERMKRWKKARKNQQLKQTYQQNVRLFMSIGKQKSVYQVPRKPLAPKIINRAELNKTTSRGKLQGKLAEFHIVSS